MTGPAVASLKLLAQATGEYTREELNKVAELGGGSSTGSETEGGDPQNPGDGGDGLDQD